MLYSPASTHSHSHAHIHSRSPTLYPCKRSGGWREAARREGATHNLYALPLVDRPFSPRVDLHTYPTSV
jgi:hypothetical protein